MKLLSFTTLYTRPGRGDPSYSYQKASKDEFVVFHRGEEIDRVETYTEARVAMTLHKHFSLATA